MKKTTLFLFSLLLFAVLATGCPGPKTSPEEINVTSIEALNMRLVKDSEIPLAFINQDKVDITHLVEITPEDPAKARVIKNVIIAKDIGEIEFSAKAKGITHNFTLTSQLIDDSENFLDDVAIGIIQSPNYMSPYDGMKATNIKGIVTGKTYKGFYIQSEVADNFGATSEGLKIHTNSNSDLPNIGDYVTVNGVINEYGSSPSNPTTQIVFTDKLGSYTKEGTKDAPEPVNIATHKPPKTLLSNFDNIKSPNYILKHETIGLDYWEALEGMRLEIPNALVISPYGYGDFFVVANDGSDANLINERKNLILRKNDPNPEKIAINVKYDGGNNQGNTWGVNVGDFFTESIIGPLGFDTYFKAPCMDLQKDDKTWWSSKVATSNEKEFTTIDTSNSNNKISISCFNIENYDAKSSIKTAALADTIVNSLKCPDIIALQEMMDDSGSSNNGTVVATQNAKKLTDKIKSIGGVSYSYLEIAPANNADGGKPGGNIRVAYFYNKERVTLADNSNGKGSATQDVAISEHEDAPALNYNPVRIQHEGFDKSRKPLLAEFWFNGQSIFVINCHFSSKRGDEPAWGINQPPALMSAVKRTKQAKRVNEVIDEILAVDTEANIVVLGDINDFPWANPTKHLKGSVVDSLIEKKLPIKEWYTYNYMGNAQMLDNIFVRHHLVSDAEVDIVHNCCEFWDQITDHEPIVAQLTIEE